MVTIFQFAAEYAASNLINALKDRVVEIKKFIKERSESGDDDAPVVKSKITPTQSVVERDSKPNKKPKRMLSHSDDMNQTNKSIDFIDNDLMQKLEKFLPISKNVTSSKKEDKVPIIESETYVEQSGSINYNKLLTDEVLATDKLLVEAAKKNMNIAGKANTIHSVISDSSGYCFTLILICWTGTTALIALIEKQQLIVANVGDSRGVMCDSKGNAIPLSFDHKPQQVSGNSCSHSFYPKNIRGHQVSFRKWTSFYILFDLVKSVFLNKLNWTYLFQLIFVLNFCIRL